MFHHARALLVSWTKVREEGGENVHADPDLGDGEDEQAD
jgi:hypothetical protein